MLTWVMIVTILIVGGLIVRGSMVGVCLSEALVDRVSCQIYLPIDGHLSNNDDTETHLMQVIFWSYF